MTEQEAKIEKLEKEKCELQVKLEQENQKYYSLTSKLREAKIQNDKFLSIIENLSKFRN